MLAKTTAAFEIDELTTVFYIDHDPAQELGVGSVIGGQTRAHKNVVIERCYGTIATLVVVVFTEQTEIKCRAKQPDQSVFKTAHSRGESIALTGASQGLQFKRTTADGRLQIKTALVNDVVVRTQLRRAVRTQRACQPWLTTGTPKMREPDIK